MLSRKVLLTGRWSKHHPAPRAEILSVWRHYWTTPTLLKSVLARGLPPVFPRGPCLLRLHTPPGNQGPGVPPSASPLLTAASPVLRGRQVNR